MTGLGQRLVPSLLSGDLRRTQKFYQTLGFELTGCFPDSQHPHWIELRHAGVVLQFYANALADAPESPICSGTFYIFPDDVNALAAQWRGVVDFAWGPEVMDYGMREFAIRDPDGYLLAFSEPADAGGAVRR